MSDDDAAAPHSSPHVDAAATTTPPPPKPVSAPPERRSPSEAPKRAESAPPTGAADPSAKISAYARLDFDNYTFYIQTLQVVLGRKSNMPQSSAHHAVDVHLSSKKAISRRHAKIFYNFASQRFELSIMGRNGAFVDDSFVEKGNTVALAHDTKVQFGDISFKFVLPSMDDNTSKKRKSKPINPSDALNMRSTLMSSQASPTKRRASKPEGDGEEATENGTDNGTATKTPTPKLPPPATEKEATALTKEEAAARAHRRNSLLKIRRLSQTRRKSLATLADNEIDDILKELGVSSIDAIEGDDSIDVQLQSILDGSVFDEEDEEGAAAAALDQQIASLAPLINAPAPPRPKYSAGQRPQLEVQVLPVPAEMSPMRYKPSLRAITVSIEPPLSSFGVPIIDDEPLTHPKTPRPPMALPPKPPRPNIPLEEISEQHRVKPPVSAADMVAQVLKPHPKGLALSDIIEGIRAHYPYFQFSQEPWQFGIAHTVKHNKMFSRLRKNPANQWVFGVDQMYLDERESVRRKQQEMLAVRTRDAALRAEEMKRYGGYNSSYTSGYTSSHAATTYGSGPKPPPMSRPGPSIKDQLAHNRRPAPSSASPSSSPAPAVSTPSGGAATMTSDTKKTLAYVQTELLTLYKARQLSFSKATTTEIITKALATTIAQVNAIGAKSGCGDNALNFLVEKAPKQVSKILDIALSKSIKEVEPEPAPSSTPSPTPAPAPLSKPSFKAKPPGLMGKPGAFSRPGPGSSSGGGLSRPPTFLSNKDKRPVDDADDSARKRATLSRP
ncbi:hypothetical protein DIRU0_C16864 [Diutina rugosa]